MNNSWEKYLSYLGIVAGIFTGMLIDWQKIFTVIIYALLGGAAGELGKQIITWVRKRKRNRL